MRGKRKRLATTRGGAAIVSRRNASVIIREKPVTSCNSSVNGWRRLGVTQLSFRVEIQA
ncbi:hypothetical protein [Paenibacillus sp. Soil522]|uniref:hypothetical protein n=1 Tax=Paenibacillus sp. Soil522 TaxID=1736388 RepID=UPI0012DEBBF7|nr:hypothetical protein [Paenibacillus sp. Soil522]